MQLLAEQNGWVIAQGQLLWTSDGGTTWQKRSPSDLQLDLRAAAFLDLNQGWVVGAGLPDAQGRSTLTVGKTQDGGLTWQLRALQEFNPIEPGSTQGAVKLSFFDTNVGYLQIKLASSSNFDLHTLLKTVDGGTTWQEVAVPDSSPVHFADALTGWTVVANRDAPLQVTNDGGASWKLADAVPAVASNNTVDKLAGPLAAAAASMGATATTLLANGTGWAFVEHGLCSGTKPVEGDAGEPFDCIQSSALLSTTDGGSTWIDVTPVVE
jgi:hypothetical protein